MLNGSRRALAVSPARGGLAARCTEPVTGETDISAPANGSSQALLVRLRSDGPERHAAIAELHRLLVRAATFELHRRRDLSAQLRGGDLEDLAQQSADDALLSIIGKLHEFRGESRFETWAYKFALYEAAAKARRRAWQDREILLTTEAWPQPADPRAGPELDAETSELLAAVGEEIDRALSPHQREVLVALALNEVPIDVLAERLNTTRGALYKTLHDARRKLRARLAMRGLNVLERGGER